MAGRPLTVDLNADVGESLDETSDRELMRWITSASVAAGFHGGNPTTMRHTIRMARTFGVAVGAHPSFPDRDGFGRREMTLPLSEVENLVLYQVAAVAGVAAAEGIRLHHVKPHGALYNMAAVDDGLARAIVDAISAIDRALIVYAPSGSRLLAIARDRGLPTAAECFADRAYDPNGSLVPRAQQGAVISDESTVGQRVVRMVREQCVETSDGSVLAVEAGTICIHSDTAGAARLAACVRTALDAAGVSVRQA